MPEAVQRLAARLRAVGFAPAVAFGALTIAVDEFEHLPVDLHALANPGTQAAFLQARLHRVVGETALVIVVLLALVAMGRTRARLVARPARSLALLLGAGTLGLVAMSTVEALWSSPAAGHGSVWLALPWWPMLGAWATLLMWGVLWGWLFLQYLRQREADRRLALVIGRRAALGRQVLEAQLGRARAQVDPATIVRVLRSVRDRAKAQAHDAVPLVDHLAGYLRLLLQRVREATPSVASDITLLRALVALHGAQAGRAIELDIHASVLALEHRPAGATFLVARLLLDTAVAAGAQGSRLALRVEDAAAMRIEASWAAPTAPSADRFSVAIALQQLQPGLRFEDQHSTTGRRLIAHVPLP